MAFNFFLKKSFNVVPNFEKIVRLIKVEEGKKKASKSKCLTFQTIQGAFVFLSPERK